MKTFVLRTITLSMFVGASVFASVPLPSHHVVGHSASRAAARNTVQALERYTLASPPAPGRIAQVARSLEQLDASGRPALLELVGRLAADSRIDRATERARVALVAGALQSLAKAPDDDAVELAKTVLSADERSQTILDAAAVVLGRRANGNDVVALVAIADDPGNPQRESAALTGLGHARVAASLRYLASRLRRGGAQSAKLADSAAFAGSSWAWEALGPSRAAEGAGLRTELIDALVDAWPNADAATRMVIGRSLVVIDANLAASRLGELDGRVAAPLRAELDELQKRVTESRAR